MMADGIPLPLSESELSIMYPIYQYVGPIRRAVLVVKQ